MQYSICTKRDKKKYGIKKCKLKIRRKSEKLIIQKNKRQNKVRIMLKATEEDREREGGEREKELER